MYVCFGFLLARSRRARTIDLQCQSLSLRQAFLLRSVCLSCMSGSRSHARFHRARMIELQWQSLSLRRAFLLRSVCLSCMYVCFSLARSLSSSKDDRPAMAIALSPSGFLASQRMSVSAPNRRESSRLLANSLEKINRKTLRKSAEDRSPETPRSTQNRLKIAPGTLPGSERPSRVDGEVIRELPEGADGGEKGSPGAFRGSQGSSRTAPGMSPERKKRARGAFFNGK